MKTREVLESALGGVLFIDEAYTLYTGLNDDFGKEALDEVLKFMEDHRRDIVIIFAGYTKEMHDFLQVNSGLQSRIPTTFDFEDYSPDEIVEIGLLGLRKQGYQVNEALYGEIVKGNYMRANDHSNGRWVRNLNEKLLRQVSTRVTREGSTDYNSILDQDLEALIAVLNNLIPWMIKAMFFLKLEGTRKRILQERNPFCMDLWYTRRRLFTYEGENNGFTKF